jgi:hypothetical protein
MDDLGALAPPGSLLGQLERGRGAGFQRARAAPVDEVIALVLDCVDRDPRCDPQLDSRADYYACLLLAAEADPAMVESLVRAHEQPPDDEWPTGNVLPLDVLVGMAARGSRQAQAAVVRYLATGARWLDVLEWGQEHYERTPRLSSWRSTVDGLGAVLCERFPSNDLLFAALEETGIAWYLSADLRRGRSGRRGTRRSPPQSASRRSRREISTKSRQVSSP